MAKTYKRKSNKRKTKRVFRSKDYKSNDGMLTTVWGPSAWHYIHTMSFNYPEKPCCLEKKNYRNFILNLRNTLPCGKCRENLHENLKKLPLTMRAMKNRTTFSKYVYQLHELINKMLGKESGLSYNDVRERYEHFRSRCTVKKRKDKENGCTEPIYGEKSKCVLKIIPDKKKCKTFQMDKKCLHQRKI
jgi:hypothetical protein